MSQAKYKQTIFWQGLLLVLVPLLLGILILSGLNHSWQDSVKSAQEESKQNNLLRQLNRTLRKLDWRMSGALSQMTRPDPNYESQESFLKDIKEEMSELKNRVKDQPQRLKSMRNMERIALSEADSLNEFPSLEPGAINVSTANQLAKTAMKVAITHTEIRKFFEGEYENLIHTREVQDEASINLNKLINIALITSLLASAAILFNFSQSFSRRIEILANKSSRLSEQKSIELNLKGTDELSYLDGVIHQTSKLLEDSAAHRQAILAMVAHDMRSPLMAAKLSLYMLEQSEAPLSDEMLSNLSDASTKIMEIVTHLDELLEKQRQSDDSEPAEFLTASAALKAREVMALPKGPFHSITNSLMKPKIFQKSLVLVLIPVLIQGYLIVQIQQQLNEVNQITRMERMFSDINIFNNMIANDFVRATSLTLAYCLTGSSKCKNRADNIFSKTPLLYEKEKKVLNQNKQWLELVEEAKSMRLQHIRALQSLSPGSSVEEISRVLFQAGGLVDQPEHELRAATARQAMMGGFNAEIKQNQIKLRIAKDQLDKTFLVSLLINLLLATLALVVFSKNIGGRLNELIKNAGLLSNKQAAGSPVKGHDEIAYLGQVIFQAQQELEKASNERLELMKLVADEMKQPLDFATDHLLKCKEESADVLSARMMTQVDRALENINRVTVLIDDLLTMETLESGRVNATFKTFDLREMTDASINAVASLAKKKDIQIENLSQTMDLVADRDRLIQVIVNLVSNAIKFSANNTTIKILSEDQGDFVKVVVSDQGPGMDKETRDRVFEKYFQAETEEKSQGFGLGLAICSLIINTHHGRLGVESEPGHGSQFWFSIPKFHRG